MIKIIRFFSILLFNSAITIILVNPVIAAEEVPPPPQPQPLPMYPISSFLYEASCATDIFCIDVGLSGAGDTIFGELNLLDSLGDPTVPGQTRYLETWELGGFSFTVGNYTWDLLDADQDNASVIFKSNGVGWDLSQLFITFTTDPGVGLFGNHLYFNGSISSAEIFLDPSDLNSFRKIHTIGSWEEVIVPIPAAIWLFGSGLIGLIGFARHKTCA